MWCFCSVVHCVMENRLLQVSKKKKKEKKSVFLIASSWYCKQELFFFVQNIKLSSILIEITRNILQKFILSIQPVVFQRECRFNQSTLCNPVSAINTEYIVIVFIWNPQSNSCVFFNAKLLKAYGTFIFSFIS